MRIAFILFHHIHHAPHLLPIAKAIAQRQDNEVTIFSSSAHNDALCSRWLTSDDSIEIIPVARGMPLPPGYNYPEPMQAMREAIPKLKNMDAIVTSSFEDIKLREIHKITRPKFIMTFHGAGDRAYGFSPIVSQFDLLLLSGSKILNRLKNEGLLKNTSWAITGYPKFDLIPTPLPTLNANTAIYNPHWSPELSSWPKFGHTILDHFATHQEQHLIFAPHVLLSGPRRPLNLSKYKDCHNIHIDLGSPDTVDMSYVLTAGLYIGDVSSQVYEFLYHRRPCLFLNHSIQEWEGDPNYRHWHLGTVCDDPTAIATAIKDAQKTHEKYITAQQEAFRETFDLNEQPSGERAADAVVTFLRSRAW